MLNSSSSYFNKVIITYIYKRKKKSVHLKFKKEDIKERWDNFLSV